MQSARVCELSLRWLGLGAPAPLKVVQMPANANSGRSSFSANHTTSFLAGLRVRLWRVCCEGHVNPPSRRSPVVGFGLILEGWNGDRTDEMEIETSRSRDPDLLQRFGAIMVLWGAW